MDEVIMPKMHTRGLSGNVLKLIALVAMTIDHIGVQLFPDILILRIIGRLAFPVFGYMIAEGCTYTKNRKKYLASVGITALVCQMVYLLALGSLYQCIFVTFFLSIVLIYLFDKALKDGDSLSRITAVIALALTAFLTFVLPYCDGGRDFEIDYGFFGILYPVIVYFAKGRTARLIAAAAGLMLVALSFGYIQWYSLAGLVLIALYNGERGKRGLKWFFYLYYPLHLCAIYFVSTLMVGKLP